MLIGLHNKMFVAFRLLSFCIASSMLLFSCAEKTEKHDITSTSSEVLLNSDIALKAQKSINSFALASIDGSWTSECFSNGVESFTREYLIKEDTITFFQNSFPDAACESEPTQVLIFDFLSEKSPNSFGEAEGVIESFVDMYLFSMSTVIYDEKIAEEMTVAKTFEQDVWQTQVEYDLTAHIENLAFLYPELALLLTGDVISFKYVIRDLAEIKTQELLIYEQLADINNGEEPSEILLKNSLPSAKKVKPL